jgi:transposase
MIKIYTIPPHLNENSPKVDLFSELLIAYKANLDTLEALLASEDMITFLRCKIFGRKSEKSKKNKPQNDPMPASLAVTFDEANDADIKADLPENPEIEITDQEAQGCESAPSDDIIIDNKPREKRGRKPIDNKLPRQDMIHDLSDDEKICTCGCAFSKIGEAISEQLEVISIQLKVIRNRRFKYVCKKCQNGVKTAKMPLQPIPKSLAAPGLLAHVAIAKFDDHLPLYRQSEIWQRFGVDLPRSTLSNWILQMGVLLKPIVDLLQQHICDSDFAQADESTMQVLRTPKKSNTSKSYMWLYKTGYSETSAIVYQYQESREGEHAKTFLKGFKGTLQTDGYSGYHCVTVQDSVTAMGCFAHARRKFVDVLKALNPKREKTFDQIQVLKEKPKLNKTDSIATKALDQINTLYEIEKKLKEDNATIDEIFKKRQKESKPILEELGKWLKEVKPDVFPGGKLHEAVTYILNQWDALITYLDDGRVPIDNNASERLMRPFAVGRKNWLFMGNPLGAKAGAVLYSLIETAKENGVNPEKYLAYVLKEIPTTDKGDLKNLLPWNTPLSKDYVAKDDEDDEKEFDNFTKLDNS